MYRPFSRWKELNRVVVWWRRSREATVRNRKRGRIPSRTTLSIISGNTYLGPLVLYSATSYYILLLRIFSSLTRRKKSREVTGQRVFIILFVFIAIAAHSKRRLCPRVWRQPAAGATMNYGATHESPSICLCFANWPQRKSWATKQSSPSRLVLNTWAMYPIGGLALQTNSPIKSSKDLSNT